MNRVKFTTSATGDAEAIAVAAPAAGFNNMYSPWVNPPHTDFFEYFLLVANGTDWEHGYGKMPDAATFNRTHIIESSNGDARLVLPAGTHTIIVPKGGTRGRIAQVAYETGGVAVAAGSDQALSFVGVLNGIQSALDLPGAQAPTLPDGLNDPRAIVPYAACYKLHLVVRTADQQAGYLRAKFTDGLYYDPLAEGWAPTDHTGTKGVSIHTPWMLVRPPIGSANLIDDSNFLQSRVLNTGAGSITVAAQLFIEFEL